MRRYKILRNPNKTHCTFYENISTYFAEVPNGVTTLRVGEGHHVEQEGLHVVVQGFVVEEELGEEAELLAVLLMSSAVHLPHPQPALAVNLEKHISKLIIL